MTRRRTATLRLRVTAAAALAVLAVLVVQATALVLAQRAALTDRLDAALVDRAIAVVGGPPAVPARSADVVVHVFPGEDGPSRTSIADGTMPDGSAARVVTRPAGSSTVVVTGSLDDVEDSVAALRNTLVPAVPVTAAALAWLVWVLAGRVLQPVERMRAEVDRIPGGRLDRRVPEPDEAGEIARLAHTINALLDRLADAAERQRRGVADAAHELRTPLARIRTQLEGERFHPDTADPAGTVGTVLAETERLQGLVDDLLLLARSDQRGGGSLDAEISETDDPGRPLTC
jgi:signal transduction histidine kinase